MIKEIFSPSRARRREWSEANATKLRVSSEWKRREISFTESGKQKAMQAEVRRDRNQAKNFKGMHAFL